VVSGLELEHTGAMDGDVIVTDRLRMPVLDRALLDLLVTDPSRIDRFSVPPDWPDDTGREYVERWRGLAEVDDGSSRWRPRAVVDADGAFVGHAGFHGPPVPIADALADPTYDGLVEPCDGGAVEIGYTILPTNRRRGYAAEAAAGLLAWGAATGEVGAVIACVRPDNIASLKVIERLGGFEEIGRCQDDGETELVLRRDLRR
jgi:RimJ/RimL family protein N-acetyltransferase